MKKLIRVLHVLSIVILVVFWGCETIIAPPETIDQPPSTVDGKIMIKVTTALNGNDDLNTTAGQIYVPHNTVLILEAGVVNPAIKIVTWSWKFPDSSASGPITIYKPKVGPGNSVTIKLTGVDDQNKSYETNVVINVTWNIVGNDLVLLLSTKMETDGSGTVTFALSTERIKKQAPPPYFVKGTINNWNRVFISDSDTSYSLVNGLLVKDQKGFYLKVVVNHKPGNHQFGLGKMIDNNTKELWEEFKGSPYVDSTNWTLMKYNLSSAGVVTPGGKVPTNTSSLPGLIGDTGNDWVINLTPNNPKLNMFINNFASFSAIYPFISLLDTGGKYSRNIVEVSVNGFPTAGSVELSYSDLPVNRMIALKIGTDIINHPDIYADDIMRKSIFYNEEHGDIRFVLCPPVLAKSSGSGGQFTIRKAVKGIDY